FPSANRGSARGSAQWSATHCDEHPRDDSRVAAAWGGDQRFWGPNAAIIGHSDHRWGHRSTTARSVRVAGSDPLTIQAIILFDSPCSIFVTATRYGNGVQSFVNPHWSATAESTVASKIGADRNSAGPGSGQIWCTSASLFSTIGSHTMRPNGFKFP